LCASLLPELTYCSRWLKAGTLRLFEARFKKFEDRGIL